MENTTYRRFLFLKLLIAGIEKNKHLRVLYSFKILILFLFLKSVLFLSLSHLIDVENRKLHLFIYYEFILFGCKNLVDG